jgi:alpha-tubulin suppressor-like RCC1 family protein
MKVKALAKAWSSLLAKGQPALFLGASIGMVASMSTCNPFGRDSSSFVDQTYSPGATGPSLIVTRDISSSGVEDTPVTVILTYDVPVGERASSCELSSLSQLAALSACTCFDGACSVQVQGGANFSGEASFRYRVRDAQGFWSNESQAAVTITAVDDAPIGIVQPLNLIEDQESVLTLQYSDAEGDPATACSVSALTQVEATSSCGCVGGVCTVGLVSLPYTSGAASLAFTVTGSGGTSASLTLSGTISDVVQSPSVQQLVVGTQALHVLYGSGRVRSMGAQGGGRLGNGSTGSSVSTALLSTAVTGATQIAGLSTGGCALKSNGTVWCWGAGASGQIGDGGLIQRNFPTQVAGLTGVWKLGQLNSSPESMCAILNDRTARCWGENGNGQLGLGDQTDRSVPGALALSSIEAIKQSSNHSCALTDNGGAPGDGHQLHCWGLNTNGQLGQGDTTIRLTPQAVAGLSDIVDVAMGTNSTCAVRAAGTVVCMGQTTSGQIGHTTGVVTGNVLSPTAVLNVTGAIEIASFDTGYCARTGTNSVWCWGRNQRGELTSSISAPYSWQPALATSLNGALELIGAQDTMCARFASSPFYRCWGASQYGEGGFIQSRVNPEVIDIPASATSLEFGVSVAGYIAADRSVFESYWMGSNASSAGSFNPLLANIMVPTQKTVPAALVADEVRVGANFACVGVDSTPEVSPAIRVFEEIRCWGSSQFRQLGVNSTSSTLTPQAVADGTALTGVVDFELGDIFGCALLLSGEIKCWGRNASGQRGDGTTTGTGDASTVVGGAIWLTSPRALSSGAAHTCAIRSSDRSIWCWGLAPTSTTGGYGRLGNGTTTGNITSPTQVTGISWGLGVAEAVEVEAGELHTCALVNDDGDASDGHQAYCWGEGNRTGTGSTTDLTQATPVAGASDLVALEASHYITCGLRLNGEVVCWGESALFAAGTSNYVNDVLTPSAVTTIGVPVSSFVRVAADAYMMCVRTTVPDIRCWGDGSTGMAYQASRVPGALRDISAVLGL